MELLCRKCHSYAHANNDELKWWLLVPAMKIKIKKIFEVFTVNNANTAELSLYINFCMYVMHANHADGSSILGSSGWGQ